MVLRNEKGRFRAATADETGVDIRSIADIPKLDNMFRSGATTFVLIYADWCGHCHRYLPTWGSLETTPGRTANMARVHYDMQENIPALKKANIEGYPSVVKVLPSGKLEEFKMGEEKTNALPEMRDEEVMKTNLTATTNYQPPPANKGEPGPQLGMVAQQGGGQYGQYGGSVLNAFMNVLQKAGPAAVLLAAYSTLPTKGSYKGPKRQSRRASSRRMKRTRRIRR
jgi:thiol-disulfide isomerase/thioredoxin